MIGLWKAEINHPFTNKITNTRTKALWYIYKEYVKKTPRYQFWSGKRVERRKNIVEWYKEK